MLCISVNKNDRMKQMNLHLALKDLEWYVYLLLIMLDCSGFSDVSY